MQKNNDEKIRVCGECLVTSITEYLSNPVFSRFSFRGLTVSVSVTTTRMSSTIFPAAQTSSEASHVSSILLTTTSPLPSAESTILSNQLSRRKRRKSKHHLVTERPKEKKRRKSKISTDIIILSEDDEVTVINKADLITDILDTRNIVENTTSSNTSLYTILEVPDVEENQIIGFQEDANTEIYKQRLVLEKSLGLTTFLKL